MWRTRIGRGYGPLVRQTEWMSKFGLRNLLVSGTDYTGLLAYLMRFNTLDYISAVLKDRMISE